MMVGFSIAMISTCYGVYITFDTLMYGIHTPGWASLAAGLAFLGGVQLIFIGVLGEYIARIYNEVKGRPNYIIEHIFSANHLLAEGKKVESIVRPTEPKS